MVNALRQLAELLRARDELDARIADITGRSARAGDLGEFIASQVFDAQLAPTATQAGHDGWFRSGPLANRTVNIKTYGDARDGLDIAAHACDFYLILSGTRSLGHGAEHRRWHIAKVYLLDAQHLRTELAGRGVRIGTATSVRSADLSQAEIYPGAGSGALLTITQEQRQMLSLFA